MQAVNSITVRTAANLVVVFHWIPPFIAACFYFYRAPRVCEFGFGRSQWWIVFVGSALRVFATAEEAARSETFLKQSNFGGQIVKF